MNSVNRQGNPPLTPSDPKPAEGKPGGPELTSPGPPRLTTTPTAPAPVSSAQLSVGATPKVSRADLEKWIASAPSNPNESRHNVYRAILDSGRPSASVMAALCRQVGDEHRVCSEFVAHVLDARANNRIDEAHCHHLLMSMLRAMGPVARHDVDVYVAAATRGFVNREGTRDYHTRLREAMMDSLSTLGEAIGLQGNNLNLKSPRWGSKAWDRANDDRRLLGHLHPDKMRADRAVNARAAIAQTAWQSAGLRDEALRRFAQGLNLGSHGESAHAPAPAASQSHPLEHETLQVRKDTKHSGMPDQPAPPPELLKPSPSQPSAPPVKALAQTDPARTATAPARHRPASDLAGVDEGEVQWPSALDQWALDVSDVATPDLPDKLRELLDMPQLDDRQLHRAVDMLAKRIDPLTLIEQWHLMAGLRIRNGAGASQVERIQSALLNSLVVPDFRVDYALMYVQQAVQSEHLHNTPAFTVQTLKEFARALDAARCHAVASQVRDALDGHDELQTEFNHAYLAARAARHPDAPAFHDRVPERAVENDADRREVRTAGVAYVTLPPNAPPKKLDEPITTGSTRKDRKSATDVPQLMAPPQYLALIRQLPTYPDGPDDSDDPEGPQLFHAFRAATATVFNRVAGSTDASQFCGGFIPALVDHIAQLSISDATKNALSTAWARQAFMTLQTMDSLKEVDLTALKAALAARPSNPVADCFERERSLFASLR